MDKMGRLLPFTLRVRPPLLGTVRVVDTKGTIYPGLIEFTTICPTTYWRCGRFRNCMATAVNRQLRNTIRLPPTDHGTDACHRQ